VKGGPWATADLQAFGVCGAVGMFRTALDDTQRAALQQSLPRCLFQGIALGFSTLHRQWQVSNYTTVSAWYVRNKATRFVHQMNIRCSLRSIVHAGMNTPVDPTLSQRKVNEQASASDSHFRIQRVHHAARRSREKRRFLAAAPTHVRTNVSCARWSDRPWGSVSVAM
jgi:hypothetical protein